MEHFLCNESLTKESSEHFEGIVCVQHDVECGLSQNLFFSFALLAMTFCVGPQNREICMCPVFLCMLSVFLLNIRKK